MSIEILMKFSSVLYENRREKIHVSWADCFKDGKGRKAMDGGLVEKKKAW